MRISVFGEVARYKVDMRPAFVLEKYQRIVWWMQQYIAPMLKIIRADGPNRPRKANSFTTGRVIPHIAG